MQTGTGVTTIGGGLDNGSLRLRVESGTLVLGKASNVNVHSAALAVTVNGGTLQLGGSGDDQIFDGGSLATTVTMNGGTFDLNGRNETFSRLEGNGGTVVNNAAGTTSTLTLGSGTTNGSSSVNGAGVVIANGAGTVVLAKVGTGTIFLTANNSHSGGVNVLGGNLALGNGGTSGTAGSGLINLSAGANLVVNRSDSFTLPNLVLGGGSLVQQGTGTLTISAPNGYLGATVVNRGTLTANLTAGNNMLPLAADLLLNGGTARFLGGCGRHLEPNDRSATSSSPGAMCRSMELPVRRR